MYQKEALARIKHLYAHGVKRQILSMPTGLGKTVIFTRLHKELNFHNRVLVIAHRLGTIRGANRIAVLEDGRITAVGSHEELLVNSPTYLRLYHLQFMDGSESRALQQLEPDAIPQEPPLLEPALSGETEE